MKSAESAQKATAWAQHLKSQKSSGNSIHEYCKEKSLSRHQFGYWQRRLKKRQSPLVQNGSAFVRALPVLSNPVQVVSPAPRHLDAKWVADFVLHLQMGSK